MAVTVTQAPLPTLYEYYTPNGTITSGLNVNHPEFLLNGREIRIYSGAMHYFRIPRKHWRDRLRKLRAAGLNTVETYVPWNLHEPKTGTYDFGQGGSDMESFLDLHAYLKTAQEEDLFAIVRPGPFICAEWEWGGLPSWLLREPGIQVRTSDSKYMTFVKRYFSVLLPILAALQFMNGGPIIAFQVENEYADSPKLDLHYLQQLYDFMRLKGIVELLVSSDSAAQKQRGTLPGLLFQTVNFGGAPESALRRLKKMQPNKPLMVMEYWGGWYDHWSEKHHRVENNTFEAIYSKILAYPASVNIYMFHGGTNFGFLNGADLTIPTIENNFYFQPVTTSYDYDAPLTEAGDYTAKYQIVKELLAQYNPVKTFTPKQPELVKRRAYPPIRVQNQLQYEDFRKILPISLRSEIAALSMEELEINNNSGQSYGYVIYEKIFNVIPASSLLEIREHVRDTVMVLINGKLISNPLRNSSDLNGFGYYRLTNSSINLTEQDLVNATLSIIVENWGRVNYGAIYHQKKGLTENNTLLLNGRNLEGPWTIYPVEFKKSWNRNLSQWKNVSDKVVTGPALYQAILTIYVEAEDTYINMEGWSKGIVIVNGFVLGRYVLIGPQKSLYLPSEFLIIGDNEIVVFEHFSPAREIRFATDLLFY